jgi:hypothetical protein
METITIEIKILNDVMTKLASLPYQEVAGLIASVHKSVEECRPKDEQNVVG